MSRLNEAPQRFAIQCPCCSAEVIHRRYGFDVIACAPRLTLTTWFVCDACEAALTGTDNAAREATVRAFEAYLKGIGHDTRH
ncbi:MAG: hypothetical protein Q8N48_02610 [Thiobacillus sp.]|nr:hypothetical protein [Thiobacillus sp.]